MAFTWNAKTLERRDEIAAMRRASFEAKVVRMEDQG
jgi:hypothetical protein